jgi:hypothetical protein
MLSAMEQAWDDYFINHQDVTRIVGPAGEVVTWDQILAHRKIQASKNGS